MGCVTFSVALKLLYKNSWRRLPSIRWLRNKSRYLQSIVSKIRIFENVVHLCVSLVLEFDYYCCLSEKSRWNEQNQSEYHILILYFWVVTHNTSPQVKILKNWITFERMDGFRWVFFWNSLVFHVENEFLSKNGVTWKESTGGIFLWSYFVVFGV